MLTLIALALLSSVFSAHYAVLVAGSNEFSNYRHQSDIFRTYKILTKNGFDPKNIITMAYDDIATSKSNPFPGKVFNVPDGPDVYIGTNNIDYKRANVTAKKWYAVLTGDAAAAGGKVLTSTANDNVFIFYNDHGSSGLLCFPTGANSYADELNNVIKTMVSKKMFKNLLFYVEACYSGSMFKNILPTNINVYAVTAANEKESSYAEYCDIAKYKTCLSNEFSQRWMENSDANNLATETVGAQFDIVKAATKMSHVMEFGQSSIKDHTLDMYQAGGNTLPSELQTVVDWIRPPTSGETPKWKRLSQEDAHLSYLKTSADLDNFGPAAMEYHNALQQQKKEHERRDVISSFFGLAYPEGFTGEIAHDMPLFRRAVETYEETCGKMNEFSVWHITKILTMAVNENKLTAANFGDYAALLKTLV